MFYALNFSGKLVHISSINDNQEYYCPMCRRKLILRTGNLKSNHFAHQRSDYHKQIRETDIHQAGKLILKKWGEELGFQSRVEVYFKKIKRRADVVLNNRNSQIVMEYQCSPLSVAKLAERSQAYSQLGIKFLWILGKRYQFNEQISQRVAQFFKYHPHLGFYIIYLNAEMQRFEVYYQIQRAAFLAPQYKIKFLFNLKELIQFMCSSDKDKLLKLTLTAKIRQLHNFQRAEMYSNGITRLLQLNCYLKKQNFHQQVLDLLSTSYDYPIYKYSREYYLLGKILGLPEKQFIYQMPLINYQNFI